jgi:phenylalanyl-tRNA synthetase beta chain
LSTGLEVAIEPGCSCRRFTAAIIEGVVVGPSPQWLTDRLEAIGQRPINNLVDATNYVMFELGQPLHGYDGARLRGNRLAARLARPGERLTTLDGADRALPEGATVVADGEGAVGVAGVMGGRDSEVTELTTTLVLEAAWWEPAPTRRTRKALGMTSEASHRFERGTDLWGLPDALRRAIEIVLTTAGGSLVDVIDVWPEPGHPPRIFLRQAEVARIVGVDLPMAVIEQTLVAIGATALAKPEDGRLAVDVPGWRRDLATEVDLVEEVARIYGYDRLPDTLRPFRLGHLADAPIELLARTLRDAMTAEGLFEVVLLPLGPTAGDSAVEVVNPLSADHRFLRKRLVPTLVRQVEANWAAQVRDVRLFEVGVGFVRVDLEGRPAETTWLAGVLTGSRWQAHWTDSGHPPDVDWWDLKGIFERAVSLANPSARIQVEGDSLIAVGPEGRTVGRAGLESADAPPWAGPVFGFEVEVVVAPRATGGFKAPPSQPAANRDLAVVVPWRVTSAQVVEEITRAAGGQLESVAVIDEYRGEGVPAGARSVAFRLTFRGKDRTLKDTEVDHAIGRVKGALEKQLGATLRSS